MTTKAPLEDRLLLALQRIAELSQENNALRAQNTALKLLVDRTAQDPTESSATGHQITGEQSRPSSTRHISTLSKAEKISLFRSLFRGREDTYPVRWENSKTSKSGYSPAIENKWEYLEAKRTRSPGIEPRYLPVTDEVIQHHLEGRIIAGVYPLLTDETCWFLAVDFDERSYEDDVKSFLATCRELEIPAYCERSRSCCGAHVWIFFESPVRASLARQLGFCILTKTLERRHQIKLTSYDRFFPNQDTLPKGGFGNLIALPLQREARSRGGSVFLHGDLSPVDDQWEFLRAVERLTLSKTHNIVDLAVRQGRFMSVPTPSFDDEQSEDPWLLPPSQKRTLPKIEQPYPGALRLVRANLLYIEKAGLSSALLNRLRLLAAFQNPEFFRHQAMRLPVFDKPRIIDCSDDSSKYLSLPRGCLEPVEALCREHTIELTIEDQRTQGRTIATRFVGTLRHAQEASARVLLSRDIALFSAPTAFGKTVLAANIIAARSANTLVLVHRQQLIDQWRERLSMFLELPPKAIGQIGAGKRRPTNIIDIATIQSLVRKGVVDDIVQNYGHVIVDECHHISAFSFEQVLKACKAKYILGLTATPKRRDGHHPIILMQCGPLVEPPKDLTSQAQAVHKELCVKHTGFTLPSHIATPSINEVYEALTNDNARNELIVQDVISAVSNGGFPLVLSERIEHIEVLKQLLSSSSYPIIVLKGGMRAKERRTALAQLTENSSPRILLATGRYIGEGFDDTPLDSLFLALPISWTGTLQQYAGRLHRYHKDKARVVVYDYVDHTVPILHRMFRKRLRGYKAMGYVTLG